MQKAYVASPNSFVYKKPNFDSQALYPLPIGKQILISKKIFRPHHNFGSFYKILLFEPKKVVGYISEAEVISEFLKQKGKYIANPSYTLAKKQMNKDRALDIDIINKSQQKSQTDEKKSSRKAAQKSKDFRKRYAGLSVGFSNHVLSYLEPRDLQVGLKLSGYNLLLSYLNMDMNLTASAYDFQSFYFDILAAYPLMQSQPYHFYALMGGNMSIDRSLGGVEDYGFSSAISWLIPLDKKLLLRGDGKLNYGFMTRGIHYGLLISLQMRF